MHQLIWAQNTEAPSHQTLEQWTRPATASRLSAWAGVSNLTRTELNQAKPNLGIKYVFWVVRGSLRSSSFQQ